MSHDAFDLDAWLRRIGHQGPRAPTLATLSAVVAAHAATIPYENIDVLLGRPPKLDLGSLQQKMIAAGRGGYCYEQNMLLRAGLLALGFTVTSQVARYLRGVPVPEISRPTLYAAHIVLRVELAEGSFLADVGCGHLTPTAPLALRPGVEQKTPHETMRFVSVSEELVLQAKFGEEWEDIYRILPHPRVDADYEVANWFTATHPRSLFVRNLIIARPGSGGIRSTLFNGRLSVRRPHNQVEQRMLDDEAEYPSVLAATFGLALSSADLSAALEALDRNGTRGVPHPMIS